MRLSKYGLDVWGVASVLAVVGLMSSGTAVAAMKATQSAATIAEVSAAQQLYGLHFNVAQQQEMLKALAEQRHAYRELRNVVLPNNVPPALVFRPQGVPVWVGNPGPAAVFRVTKAMRRPENLDDLAYATIPELEYLVRSHQVTATQLTEMYLRRLEKYGPRLYAVVTVLKTSALARARQIDRELAAGQDPGPLAGIPYGVKDLFAVRGARTTWGAAPYRNQMINATATVVQRLNKAGAILVGKLSSGALAMGDVWFGGKTRNPWNLKQGSSGSSAGPAASVSAGLVPFALGTETLGSIISPSTRTGITGFRPTFGRDSRAGVMALAWSMDKVGVLCRVAEDCARVFSIIQGYDPKDPSTVNAAFSYAPLHSLAGVRIGYLKAAFARTYPGKTADLAALAKLRRLGAHLVPITLPKATSPALRIILSAEAATAFQHLTLSPRINLLTQQGPHAWPNIFRAAQFIPAVEYLQANRLRTLLVEEMDQELRRANVEVYVAPSLDFQDLLDTNLTGQPAVAVPDGMRAPHEPTTISFIGRLFADARVLEIAQAYEDATPFWRAHPPAFR